MNKQIKLTKKFISFFLVIMILYSMVFTGIKVSAATTGLTISVNDSSNQSIPKYTNDGGSRIDTIFNSNNSVKNTPVRLAADATAKISYNFTNATTAKYKFVEASNLNTVPQLPLDSTMTDIKLPAPNSYDAYANDIGTRGTISTMQYVYAGNPGSASSTAKLTRDVSFGTPLSSTMLVQNAIQGSDIPNYTVSGSTAFLPNTTVYTGSSKSKTSTYYVWNPFNSYYMKPSKNAAWKAMKFWGYFSPPDDGYYKLGANSDDGSYGYIIANGQTNEFVNDWSINAAFNRTNDNPIKLSGGSYYPIYMEWYEGCPTDAAFTPVYRYSKSSATSGFSNWANIPQNWFYSSKTTTPGTIPGAYFGDVSGIKFPTQDGIYYIATKFVSGEGTTSGLYGPFIIDKTPPTISNLYVESNNSSSKKKAIAGNTLTINFTASETLQGNPQILINGYVANATYTNISGNNYTATVKIGNDSSIDSSGDTITNGPITVKVDHYSDLFGNVGDSVQDNSVTFISSDLGITLSLTQNPTTLTNGNVVVTANATAYGNGNSIKTMKYASGNQSLNYFSAGGTVLIGNTFTVSTNGTYTVYAKDNVGNESVQTITISNIDTIAPTITLSQIPISTTNVTNGTVTITASASDNVSVASITKPDNTVIAGSSTTYTVSANGTYTFTATDTAGNVTIQSINISNIAIPSTNDTLLPNIGASLKSFTPNPAKSSDEITVKYNINTVPFSLSSGMINEAVVLVDMSQAMKSNQRFSEVQNGFVNQVINDSNLSSVKLGVVGYNDSVYIGTRSNYNDPKSCVMKKTDENLSNIDKTNFLPLYNLNDANTKDGYRQFYQNGYIYNNISSNDQRQFGSALKVADKILTGYGNIGVKKAIVIVSSGNLTYSDAQIESIRGKGYKIIILDISNSDSANIKDTYMKLCGNEFGINGNYYKGTLNDGVNYNSVDADMKKVDESLKGIKNVTTLNIKDAKLNIDLGENFKAVEGGGLEGSGKIRTVTIPQINFTYNSTTGLWEQSEAIEIPFKVQSEVGKYGDLSFGVYTNIDNTTDTNSSTISYTDFYNIPTNKTIDTPTININKTISPPVITSPTEGTVTNKNKPIISGTAEVNSTVKVYDGATFIGKVTTDGNGNWTLIPSTGLIDGTHAITATGTDEVGNVSPPSNTVNITIDTIVPTITLTPSTTALTNNNVTVTANVTDNVGVAITKWTSGNQTTGYFVSGGVALSGNTFPASANGIYTVYAKDTAGNESVQTITISNIDKTPPTLILTQTPTTQTDDDITINVTVTDNTSVAATKWLPGTKTIADFTIAGTVISENSFTVSENGVYTVYAIDTVGNAVVQTITIRNIYATVEGTVIDDITNNPISGATISVKNSNGGVISTATTDATGKYILNVTAPLEGIQVTITAAAHGYIDKDVTSTLFGRVEKYTQDFSLSNLYVPSTILAHGLYKGESNIINDSGNGFTVTDSIPLTLAMTVDAKSSTHTIKLSIDDNKKISEGNIVFKKYEISSTDGTIGNLQTLTFSNSGEIDLSGFTMEKGKKYIIIYTITPVESGDISLIATADSASSKSVKLNISPQPDLF